MFLSLSCQTKRENKDDRPASSIERERNIFFSHLKAPAEVALLLHQSKVDFNVSLLNDPKNSIHYMSNEVKTASNLGVFLADLNYCLAYKESDYATELFTVARELSQAIGIEKSVLTFLKSRYSDNIAQNDSVKIIVDNLFTQATAPLRGTVNENLVGIAMGAYEIENLHILLKIIEHNQSEALTHMDSINLAPLFRLVVVQRLRIEIIYSFLKSITDPLDPNRNPNFPYYANAFEELIGVYYAIERENGEQDPQSQEWINDNSLKELSEKVNAIRSKIVQDG
jgi:hypothetical protein